MIDDDHIRQRAYELWELAGNPDGDPEAFWHQAREQLIAEQQPAAQNTLDSAGGHGQSGIAQPVPGTRPSS